MNPDLLADFLATSMRLSIPLVFAAVGGVLCERSGVFNIGLEGMILAGAFGAAVGAFFFESAWAGLMVGLLIGTMMGLMLATLTVPLRADQIVSGIAINILVLGVTAFISRIAFEGQGNTTQLTGFSPIEIPGLASIPVIGPVLFHQDILVYVMYAVVLITYVVLFYTPWGLSIQAVGENPRAAAAMGVPVNRLRFACVSVGCAIAGLGGCYLVLSQVFIFSEHMSAGKGFVALAAIILGRWNPAGALAACLFFGICDALQLRLQFSNPDVPYQIFVIIPYAASILALIGIGRKVRSPASVGIPYKREAG